MEGEVIFDGGWEFAIPKFQNYLPIPKWFTLFYYIVGKRRVLTKEELAEELAGEP